MRTIALVAALLLPAEWFAGATATEGMVVTVCTSAGPVRTMLDETGKPRGPSPCNPTSCAHLWCQARPKRRDGRSLIPNLY